VRLLPLRRLARTASAEGGNPPGARGTARPARHRPVVARRQRLPLSGRDDPRASSWLVAQFPAPL